MRLKYTLILLIISASLNLTAQPFSAPGVTSVMSEKVPADYYVPRILEVTDQGNVFYISVLKGKAIITKLDSRLNILKVQKLSKRFSKGNIEVRELVARNGQLAVLYSRTERKADKVEFDLTL